MAKRKSDVAIRGDRSVLSDLYLSEGAQDKELDSELIASIALGLERGLSPKDACAIVLISPHLYDNWYQAGKALLEGRSDQHIPDLIPRQPHEDRGVYRERKREWMAKCDLLVHFFLLCNQSKQKLNNKMLTTMVQHASSEQFDAWKAAREVLRITGGTDYNPDQRTVQTHEHIVSGEVVHTHRDQQVHVLIENLRSVAGSALADGKDKPTIVIGDDVGEEAEYEPVEDD